MPLWPVTQRYMDTLARSHNQVNYFEIIRDGIIVSTVVGGTIVDPRTGGLIYTTDGSVTVGNTTIRRSGTVIFADPTGDMTPLHSSDLLAPYITEIRCWVGVQYWDATNAVFGGSGILASAINENVPDPTVELVPVATLVVTNPTVSGHQITIQGYDRMWLLGNFPAQYNVARGTLLNDALTGLVTISVPAHRLDYEWSDTEQTVGAMTFDADTPIADALAQVAAAGGKHVAVDPMGKFFSYDPPSTDDNPDLILSTGQFSTMMRPERSIGDGSSGPYNAVVFTNEGGNYAPARGYAEDDNSDSLTAVSRIGVRPIFMSSPIMPDQDTLNKAARTALMHILGVNDTTTLIMMPNHALDTDVLVQVTDPSQGIYQMNVITDNFTIPFRASAGVMTVQCRTNVSVA